MCIIAWRGDGRGLIAGGGAGGDQWEKKERQATHGDLRIGMSVV